VTEVGWQRLGREIASERGRHWRSRAAFARASGVSERVIDDIENGNRSNYLDATLAAIEAALGWAPGSCLRIVQGGRVRREHDPLLVRLLDSWRLMSPDARELLVMMAEQAARARR
jgi:transcriptional regulator with XRE-family HTH domain